MGSNEKVTKPNISISLLDNKFETIYYRLFNVVLVGMDICISVRFLSETHLFVMGVTKPSMIIII